MVNRWWWRWEFNVVKPNLDRVWSLHKPAFLDVCLEENQS